MADEIPSAKTKEEEAHKESFIKPSKKGSDSGFSDMAGQFSTVARTVKLMEDKYYNLRKKVQINEENSLEQDKKISSEIKVMQSDIMDMKRAIEDIKDKMMLIVKELKLSAKSEDIKIVQKYLDMWEPIEFVTRNEAKKMIERAVEDKFR